MTGNQFFNQLVDQAMQDNAYFHMRPVITKELLHYDILFSLEKENILDKLTFQGGTCLRLCYGAERLSEDLDFVTAQPFKENEALAIKNCIETYIGKRYALKVEVKQPRELASDRDDTNIKVNKWQVAITTSPDKKDMPKQKIKIEIANVPAYSRMPQGIKRNYEFLPDGYEDLLVMCESLDEIMADKIVSLVNCQKYIRHRDIWDLRWLIQRGAKLNIQYVKNKIRDYHANNYNENLSHLILNIDSIIQGKNFNDEMSRFIPSDVQIRTLKSEKFLLYLANEMTGLLKTVRNQLLGVQ